MKYKIKCQFDDNPPFYVKDYVGYEEINGVNFKFTTDIKKAYIVECDQEILQIIEFLKASDYSFLNPKNETAEKGKKMQVKKVKVKEKKK